MKPSIYQIFPRIELENRCWPNSKITSAPTWCSTDLRDANQALPKPIQIENKLMLFAFLVSLGFKEIEVGTPGRSEDDYLFIRRLIEENHIPDDVTIQVMSQLKESSIDRAIDSLVGCSNSIINLCQSTSSLRRQEIFDMGDNALITHVISKIAYAKTRANKVLSTQQYQFAFSAEGFNTTEPLFLEKLCQAVIEIIQPNKQRPMILNWLAAVETDLPNYFADQIEWLIKNLKKCEFVTFSVQTHNDRGSAVASSELAILAGVERVEGCLLAHGERAGACCLLTMALNLYSHGIEPQLDFSDVAQVVEIYEHCTGMECPPRHPYAGDLVFAAFSAPHQFAIHEAFNVYLKADKNEWLVPYLPMDPCDIGRGNDDVIRLNALSGRTGISYVMEKNHGYILPKGMQKEFSLIIKERAAALGAEISSEQVWQYFADNYFKGKKILELKSVSFEKDKIGEQLSCVCEALYLGDLHHFSGRGAGALDTVISALKNTFELSFDVLDYNQHALGHGSTATAVSYINIIDVNNNEFWGVGVDQDTTLATLGALFCSLNRKMEKDND